MRIFKYQLEIKDEQKIQMPKGATILSVAVQGGTICVWALANEVSVLVNRQFAIHGTGERVTHTLRKKFLGTVIMTPFIWHVFEVAL